MPLLISRWILSHCVAEITGPICAPLAGSPTVVASAAALAIAIASAMREFGTSMRVGALHDLPEFPMTPPAPPRRDGALEVGIGEDDVRRFATEFLVHALDGLGRVARHFDARARRTGE